MTEQNVEMVLTPPAPNMPQMPPILVAVDTGTSTKSNSIALGASMLDLAAVRNIGPGNLGCHWAKEIKSFHFPIEETLKKTAYGHGNHKFDFLASLEKSATLPLAKMGPALQDSIAKNSPAATMVAADPGTISGKGFAEDDEFVVYRHAISKRGSGGGRNWHRSQYFDEHSEDETSDGAPSDDDPNGDNDPEGGGATLDSSQIRELEVFEDEPEPEPATVPAVAAVSSSAEPSAPMDTRAAYTPPHMRGKAAKTVVASPASTTDEEPFEESWTPDVKGPAHDFGVIATRVKQLLDNDFNINIASALFPVADFPLKKDDHMNDPQFKTPPSSCGSTGGTLREAAAIRLQFFSNEDVTKAKLAEKTGVEDPFQAFGPASDEDESSDEDAEQYSDTKDVEVAQKVLVKSIHESYTKLPHHPSVLPQYREKILRFLFQSTQKGKRVVYPKMQKPSLPLDHLFAGKMAQPMDNAQPDVDKMAKELMYQSCDETLALQAMLSKSSARIRRL
ncbi:hypothetical protein BKA80DRAFT_255657 [Phyllosticta citrichinensis]